MSYDDLDMNHAFEEAVRNVADQIGINPRGDPYGFAAYNIPTKLAYPSYGSELRGVLWQYENKLDQYQNQVTRDCFGTELPHVVQQWLSAGRGCTWVHCTSKFRPNPAVYRVYICAALNRTPQLLWRLLKDYPGEKLYFKIASHDEAQRRNDTIVSWHETLAEAMLWCNIANRLVPKFPQCFLGNAPAGTFGGIGTRSVGIDVEEPGSSSTGRIAKRGLELARRRVERSPYI